MDGLVIGWPEGILLALVAIQLIVKSHDESPGGYVVLLLATLLIQFLLWWGGFYF